MISARSFVSCSGSSDFICSWNERYWPFVDGPRPWMTAAGWPIDAVIVLEVARRGRLVDLRDGDLRAALEVDAEVQPLMPSERTQIATTVPEIANQSLRLPM